jgi:hypothetical protein
MHSLQDVHAMRELVMEREARLRGSVHVLLERPLRRWLGRRLVAIGAWIAAEPMQAARAR